MVEDLGNYLPEPHLILPGFMPGSLANYQVWRGIQITNANITLQIRSDNDVNVVSVSVHNNNRTKPEN